MRFTLKQLEYFVAAAEAGSITRASAKISISQPAISSAISFLEQELGVTLFLRQQSQGVVLTPAGHGLLEQVKAMLEIGETLYDAANRLNTELRGSLTVGCLVTLAPLVLPGTCHAFTERYPGVQINLFEGSQDRLIGGLRRAEIDVGLTYDMLLPDDIAFVPLVALPPHLLTAAGHTLAERDSVTLSELAECPYILLDLPHSRDYFLSLFADAQMKPNITMRSSQPEVVRTMVANGYGVTISVVRPRNEFALDGSALASVPLRGDGIMPLPLGYVTAARVKKSFLLDAFESHLRESITANHIPGMRAAVT